MAEQKSDPLLTEYATKKLIAGIFKEDLQLIIALGILTDKSIEECEIAVFRSNYIIQDGFRRIK